MRESDIFPAQVPKKAGKAFPKLNDGKLVQWTLSSSASHFNSTQGYLPFGQLSIQALTILPCCKQCLVLLFAVRSVLAYSSAWIGPLRTTKRCRHSSVLITAVRVYLNNLQLAHSFT